jgi:hypothetical protein
LRQASCCCCHPATAASALLLLLPQVHGLRGSQHTARAAAAASRSSCGAALVLRLLPLVCAELLQLLAAAEAELIDVQGCCLCDLAADSSSSDPPRLAFLASRLAACGSSSSETHTKSWGQPAKRWAV